MDTVVRGRVFYRFVFETRTDENARFPKSGERTDQFYGDEGSTHLYALHVLRRSVRQMVQNNHFQACWDYKLELRPLRLRMVVNRNTAQGGPPDEEQHRTKQRSQSLDASMSESVSMSGSRDVVNGQKEDG